MRLAVAVSWTTIRPLDDDHRNKRPSLFFLLQVVCPSTRFSLPPTMMCYLSTTNHDMISMTPLQSLKYPTRDTVCKYCRIRSSRCRYILREAKCWRLGKHIFVFQKRCWKWRSGGREKPYRRWDTSFRPLYMGASSVWWRCGGGRLFWPGMLFRRTISH